MKILIVARYKHGEYAPFITEQVAELESLGINCRFFPVCSNGVLGYLKHVPGLRRAIKEFQPDLIHAHYGLCGLLCNFQRKVSVVTTYHGSDINNPRVLPLSRLAMRLSGWNVFVSKQMIDRAGCVRKFSLVPCGVNLDDYVETDKAGARKLMGLQTNLKYIIFAGAFDNAVKNVALAREVMSHIEGTELLELKGYTRRQVALLMYAADALLMTSKTEGSPQVIKEALACGLPIVSVDVGDVRERIADVKGCHVTGRDADDMAAVLTEVLAENRRTDGRAAIERKGLSGIQAAKSLIDIYKRLVLMH